VTPTGASTPVRTLLLEPQRTNLCIRSQEFDTWTQIDSAVTANSTVAPDGTTTADTINATSNGGRTTRGVTFTGDGEKCVSVWLRAGTAAVSQVALQDGTVPAQRHRVNVTWTAGVPAVTTASGAGTIFPPESYGNGWYRIMFSATGVVAANSNSVAVVAAVTTGTVLAWGAQAENAVVPSSYIPTEATTVTRNADSLYWDIPALVPREMTVYVRSVNIQQSFSAGSIPLFIGNGAAVGTRPRLYLSSGSPTATDFRAIYSDASTDVTSAVAASSTPSFGSVLEHALNLSSDGRVRVSGSVDGGAEAVGAQSSALALPAAWAMSRLYLAGLSSNNVAIAATHLAIALGTKTRAEMRAIAGVP